MPLKGIVLPEQLSVLAGALQAYCSEAKITLNSPAFHAAGKLVMQLFEEGFDTSEELAEAPRKRASDPVTATLEVGERVMRKVRVEGGTVVSDANNQIKMLWDGGGTSYFRRGAQGNVRRSPNPG